MDAEERKMIPGAEPEGTSEALKSFLFSQFPETEEKLFDEEEEETRLGRFEETLRSQLHMTDTFGEAVEKVVTTAIVMEFGVSLTREQGFQKMVHSIGQAIMVDNQLRKQAMLLINMYCKK